MCPEWIQLKASSQSLCAKSLCTSKISVKLLIIRVVRIQFTVFDFIEFKTTHLIEFISKESTQKFTFDCVQITNIRTTEWSLINRWLTCHLAIKCDQSFATDSERLDSCTDITFSSVHNLFDVDSSDYNTAASVSDREILAKFVAQHNSSSRLAFSLQTPRDPPHFNLEQLFYSAEVMDSLVNFMRSNGLESFDISWAYLQSVSIDPHLLAHLKSTLHSAGFRFTATFHNQMETPDPGRMQLVAQSVDHIFIAPDEVVSTNLPQRVFRSLEEDSGTFLNVYLALNMSRNKIIVGQSIRTMTWTFNKNINVTSVAEKFIVSGIFEDDAVLQTESYHNSCKHFQEHILLEVDPPEYSFHRMAISLSENQLIFRVDPEILARRMGRIVGSGFAGIALYEYHSGHANDKCSDILSLMDALIRSPSWFPTSSILSGVCVPFLGLSHGCRQEIETSPTPAITDPTLVESTEIPQTLYSSIEENGNKLLLNYLIPQD